MIIALCQINPVAGNVPANREAVLRELRRAREGGARLAVFPELCLTGYPPKDLLEYGAFIEQAHEALSAVHAECRTLGIDAIVGTIHTNVFGGKKELLNAAAVCEARGGVRFSFKKLLPTYDVFDEHRYFQPCPADAVPLVLEFGEDDIASGSALRANPVRIGITICEDIWNDGEFWKNERLYETDPVVALVNAGANMLVNISASPYVLGKPQRRLEMLRHTASRWHVPVLLVNQVGGCDQVVFDGGSAVILPDGSLPAAAGWFREDTVLWNTHARGTPEPVRALVNSVGNETNNVLDALVLGLRDYLAKTGFRRVIVGNSGGIDSAVVLTLAVHALGANAAISVSMPGPFTSEDTRSDSTRLAANLGVQHFELPISGIRDEFERVLQGSASPALPALFGGSAENVLPIAAENLQSRIRGTMLMWLSNALGSEPTLVLSTGNKSEIATGYCTLYGDMAGGLAVISDVPKMMVYELARLLNGRMASPIPQTILDRAPTAELAHDQKDSDSLPPYPVLDEIVRLFVEERLGLDEIVSRTEFEPATVRRVLTMIQRAEYKRQQAAPGLKVTSKAFGFGRRMPIATGTGTPL